MINAKRDWWEGAFILFREFFLEKGIKFSNINNWSPMQIFRFFFHLCSLLFCTSFIILNENGFLIIKYKNINTCNLKYSKLPKDHFKIKQNKIVHDNISTKAKVAAHIPWANVTAIDS